MKTSTNITFTSTEVDTLRKLSGTLKVFSDIHPGMTINQVRTFLEIAINNNGLQTELIERLKQKESAVSKNLQYWFGRIKHKDCSVPQAINITPNIKNRRLNDIGLNENGAKILKNAFDKLGVVD